MFKRLIALSAVTAVSVLAFTGNASAQAPVTFGDGVFPQDLIERFGKCPRPADFPADVSPLYCLHVTAYDGELKLGKVQASIEKPIKVLVGVGLKGFQPVIVMAKGGGGAPEPVKVSGGILGVPALDPVADHSLGLLSLAATPQLGALSATREDLTPTHLPKITMPLSIKLDNTLFGSQCTIPQFTINLTTGTTTPPAGVPAISGKPPTTSGMTNYINYPGGGPFTGRGIGARSVDNAFAVPAATKCDPLPRSLHSALDAPVKKLDGALGGKLGLTTLIGNQGGLFNPTINSMAGLPSPAGRNHMMISIDTEWITYDAIPIIDGQVSPLYSLTPATLRFGDVQVGDSAVRTTTVTNPTASPLALGTETGFDLQDDAEFEILGGECTGAVLDPGESCTFAVRFTPNSPGFKYEYGYHEIAGENPVFGSAVRFSTEGTGVTG